MTRRSALLRLCPAALAVLIGASSAAAPPETPVYRQEVAGFVSAKGERALLMGYPDALEIWAYPLQLASDYRLRFRVAGSVEPIDAAPLLRRVDRFPTEVVRTYVGANFVVRERLFVPRQQAGAVLSYEVDGRPDVQIEAGFRPSLNLMWPAAIGGRTVTWDASRSGYVEREPLHGFSATIASPEAVAHDDPINATRPASDRLTMLLAPRPGSDGQRRARVVFALDPAANTNGALAIAQGLDAAHADAARHIETVLTTSIQIDTPDPAVNRALASAVLALDGAWACNDRIGCGVLGGYGPSRAGRRPQYAWFFAGDGLVAMEGMLEAGQFERARDELAFITRYQQPGTGMIWHEMSQSAGLIDWVGRYPYMYVHVDITFQYLAAVQRYVAATGDVAFARTHWRALASAWRYCRSVIDAGTGLPSIPHGKQGQNEQEELRDDIGLSSAWIDAADGFAELAAVTAHGALSRDARAAAARARAAIAADGWDEANGFWLSGHRRDGTPVQSQRPGAIGILNQAVLSAPRTERVLDHVATPDFIADWGVRSLSARDPRYDPNLYSSGSVWSLGSAGVAETFWRRHRPLNGWAIWRGMVDADTLDSAGHLHEVLAGDTYHAEYESVPEQTWSSAGLLTAATRGLFGLEVRPREHAVTFAPHLPTEWDGATLRNVRVGDARVALRLRQDAHGIDLIVENSGAPLSLDFAPAIPLGAEPGTATVDGNAAQVALVTHQQDRHARISVAVRGQGTTRVRIPYVDGVGLVPVRAPAAIGARSRNPVVATTMLDGDTLRIDAWVVPGGGDQILMTTQRIPRVVSGAQISTAGAGRYRVTLTGVAATPEAAPGYVRRSAVIEVARRTKP